MTNDAVALNEIATNERVVEHTDFGRFLIRRPTHRVEAEIETARTRQINKDLQAREVVLDPNGEQKFVPAFLTRGAKAEQLQFHNLWTLENDIAIEEALNRYREVCKELDEAGFEGAWVLDEHLVQLRSDLNRVLGVKADRHADHVSAVAPDLDNLSTLLQLKSDVVLAAFGEARAALRKAGKCAEMDKLLNEADGLHKLCGLYADGVTAQAELVQLRMIEFGLFADTLEARADKAAQVAKVFYCVLDPRTKKQAYGSVAELEADQIDKVAWLLGEVERFERLDSNLSEMEAKKRERFNFLAPLPVRSDKSDALPATETSKPAGDSPEPASTTSTEASAS
jgi:hypothetical protein